MNEKKVFAEGVGFQKLFIVFVVGSIFGCYYEMILNLVRHLLQNGEWFWEIRSGVIYGPFSTVYGLGAVLMTKFLVGKDYKWWQILLYGAVLGGVCEYLISFLQETFTGTTSWDYSDRLLDINGRTTIPIMFFWGLICLVYVRFVYPAIDFLVGKIPIKSGTVVLNVVIVALCLDMFISYSAVVRQHLRRSDVPPYTFYGRFLDQHYTDERMRQAYPNMVVTGDK